MEKNCKRFWAVLLAVIVFLSCLGTGDRKVLASEVSLSGVAHIQTRGNVAGTWDGSTLTLGTTGEGKRMEAVTINFSNSTAYTGTLQYRVHRQSYGWTDWVDAGTQAGTVGEGKRLEAIQIRLTGELAEYYSIRYQVHIQTYGWNQGWQYDGAIAGTTGESKRLEALQVQIVPKNTSSEDLSYRVHRQTYGWEKTWKTAGQSSGTVGQSKRLEGISISLTGNEKSGGIEYRTHIQSYGWEKVWKSNGEMSGTQGEAKRLEAIQIRLTGEIANYYDVYYRVHAQSYGWLGWAKNGDPAGTAGYSKRLEAIQIVLVKKGDTPSDSLDNALENYTNKYSSLAFVSKTGSNVPVDDNGSAYTSNSSNSTSSSTSSTASSNADNSTSNSASSSTSSSASSSTSSSASSSTSSTNNNSSNNSSSTVVAAEKDEVTVDGVTFNMANFKDTLVIEDDGKYSHGSGVLAVIPDKDVDYNDISYRITGADVEQLTDENTSNLYYAQEGEVNIGQYYVGGWDNMIAYVSSEYNPNMYLKYRCEIYHAFTKGSFNVSVYYKNKLLRTCKVVMDCVYDGLIDRKAEVASIEKKIWTDDMTAAQKLHEIEDYVYKNYIYEDGYKCNFGARVLYYAAKDLGLNARYRFVGESYDYSAGWGDVYYYDGSGFCGGHVCTVVTIDGKDEIFETNGRYRDSQ